MLPEICVADTGAMRSSFLIASRCGTRSSYVKSAPFTSRQSRTTGRGGSKASAWLIVAEPPTSLPVTTAVETVGISRPNSSITENSVSKMRGIMSRSRWRKSAGSRKSPFSSIRTRCVVCAASSAATNDPPAPDPTTTTSVSSTRRSPPPTTRAASRPVRSAWCGTTRRRSTATLSSVSFASSYEVDAARSASRRAGSDSHGPGYRMTFHATFSLV